MTFKPEIGKRHVTRGGKITDVVKYDELTGCLYSGESFPNRKMFWYPTGVFNFIDLHNLDLVAVYEEPQYYWMNAYPTGLLAVHKTKEKALKGCVAENGGKTLKLKVVEDDE